MFLPGYIIYKFQLFIKFNNFHWYRETNCPILPKTRRGYTPQDTPKSAGMDGGRSGGLWLFLQLYFVLGRWITIRGFPAIPYHQPQVDDRSLWFHIIPHPPGG